MKVILCYISVILFNFALQLESNTKLIFSFVAEGSKSPAKLNSLGQDIFKESWEKASSLTPKGYRSLYLAGVRDAYRFNEFLGVNYSESEVKSTSGNSNSMIMSAQAYLKGLFYKSNGPQLFLNQIDIAFPPLNQTNSNLIALGTKALPYNTEIYPVKKFENYQTKKYFFLTLNDNCLPVFHKFSKNKKAKNTKLLIFDIVETYGEQLKKSLDLKDVSMLKNYDLLKEVVDTYLINYSEGRTLSILSENGFDKINFNSKASEFKSNDLKYVRNGDDTDHFLPNATISAYRDDIINAINRRISADQFNGKYSPQNPKMYHNSVTEMTLMSIHLFIKKLKLVHNISIYPGSSILFELKLKDGIENINKGLSANYIVNYYSDDTLISSFSVKEFIDILSDAMSHKQMLYLCARDLKEKYGYKNATIVLGVLCGINLISLVLTIRCFLHKKNDYYKNKKEETNSGHHKYKESETNLKKENFGAEMLQTDNANEMKQEENTNNLEAKELKEIKV